MGELTPAQAHGPFFLLAHLYPSSLSMTMDEQMNAIHPSLEPKTNSHSRRTTLLISPYNVIPPTEPNRKNTPRGPLSLFSSPACLLLPSALGTGDWRKAFTAGRQASPLWLTTHSPSDAPWEVWDCSPRLCGLWDILSEPTTQKKPRRGGRRGAAAAASHFPQGLSALRF